MSVSPPWLACALGLVTLCVAGCYDHRVTQAIMERQRRAKQAEGSKIGAAPHVKSAKYDARLKLYVADDYRKQHSNWKEPLLDLIDQANGVLIPGFGVRLEVVQAGPWSPACDGAELQLCLEELAGHDAGAPDEWVVGVLGSQARFTESFDELGRAFVRGHHMLIRDVSDLAERDAIDQAFPAMGQERREDIYKHRKRHKRLAVFLHEWAHTLGAEHSSDRSSLLFPSYDDRMTSYDETSASVIAGAIEPRFKEAAQGVAAASAPHAGGQSAGAAPQASPSAFVVRGSDEQELAALKPRDRAVYKGVASRAGKAPPDALYTELEPLVARYPDCYPVQHLACGLLMQLGRQQEVQSVCGRVQALSRKK